MIAVLAIVKANDGLEGGSRWAWAVPLGTLGVYLLVSLSFGFLPRLLSRQFRGGSQILPWGEVSERCG